MNRTISDKLSDLAKFPWKSESERKTSIGLLALKFFSRSTNRCIGIGRSLLSHPRVRASAFSFSLRRSSSIRSSRPMKFYNVEPEPAARLVSASAVQPSVLRGAIIKTALGVHAYVCTLYICTCDICPVTK